MAARQQRWRNATSLRRIDVYLPQETLAQLDALAADTNQSRAKMIAALVQDASNQTTRR